MNCFCLNIKKHLVEVHANICAFKLKIIKEKYIIKYITNFGVKKKSGASMKIRL